MMTSELFIASDDDELASPQRRTVLKGATASLVVGFWSGPKHALAAQSAPKPAYEANAFVTVGADDSVTLTIAKIEMGQGTYTSIPMLVAEELEVDVAKVNLRHAPPDAKTYGLPIGDQFTGGTPSMRFMFEPPRQAPAAVRPVLIQAAPRDAPVAPGTCFAEIARATVTPSA